jgi:hypothetical protein
MHAFDEGEPSDPLDRNLWGYYMHGTSGPVNVLMLLDCLETAERRLAAAQRLLLHADIRTEEGTLRVKTADSERESLRRTLTDAWLELADARERLAAYDKTTDPDSANRCLIDCGCNGRDPGHAPGAKPPDRTSSEQK